MKKKIFSFIIAICLALPCAFLFTGCGEEFIEERTYNLLGMTIIKDNTPYNSPFDDGQYSTSFCGEMSIEKTKLNVGRKSSTLTFDDSQASGIKAVYQFDVYTDKDVYPAYTFKSYTITLNGADVTNLPDSEVANLDESVREVYEDVKVFSEVCLAGNTSIQLITQNKSLACHIIVTDKNNGSLIFMSMLYGY